MRLKSQSALILNGIIFSLVLMVVFAAGFTVIKTSISVSAQEETDETPPELYNIKIEGVSATSAIIKWETNEEADSMINYGLDKNYGIVRDPRFDKTEHQIILDSLMPNTSYHFRITSSDEHGNQGISSDFNFLTPEDSSAQEGGPHKNIEESLEEVLDRLRQITDMENEGIGPDELDEGSLGEIYEMLKKISGEMNLETEIERGPESGDMSGGDADEYVRLEEVIEMIEQISSEESLEEIQEEIEKQAEETVQPPTIILDYADVEVGTDYAIISWETDKEANSVVSLAEERDYNPDAEDPYRWKEGEPDEYVTVHTVEVNGLRPATTYHFRVSSKSRVNLEGRSSDKTFKTKSIQPEIYNIQLSKVEEESATIKYTTNVPCSSVIEYTNLNTNESKLEGNSSFLTVHTVKLTNLIFDTYYSAVIKVESEDGEQAESDPLTFITIKDEYPPEISKVSTESTIYPGSENKIQTLASWSTDEPAKCQFFYHQGLMAADEPGSMPIEEDYALKHVQVITNFLPSSVYKFWIVCSDEAGNEAKSENFTMLTPTQEESIIDIILKNFESSFGWVKKMSI